MVALAATSVGASEGALQRDVDANHRAGAVGVLAEIVDHGRSTKARAGVAERDDDGPVPWSARFRTGSTTKTFVAATVLQLVGEGHLSLTDTVERWLPGVIRGNGNDGSQVTVRQLLNHTSGLFDYTSDDAFFATLSTPEAFHANRFRRWTPQDLIAIAVSHPPDFAPGTSWSYSNTGYVVIGEIIKAVTGKPWDQEVTERIIRPLHLRGTSAPANDPSIPGPHAHSYHIYSTDPQQRVYTDTTLNNLSWGGSAGALITTTEDENRFFAALMTGQVLAPALLAEMKTTVEIAPGFGYGLGLLWTALACAPGGGYWSHDGGTVGFSTLNGVTDDGALSIVVSRSTTTFTDDQYVTDSVAAGDTLLEHVFCGPSAAAAPPLQRSARPTRLRGITRSPLD
jgi:D-alanyl-D-alanine carboxypeptidase